MPEAMNAIQDGAPIGTISNILASFTDVVPHTLLDRIGAVVDVPGEAIAAISGMPGVAAISSGAIPDLGTLRIPPKPFHGSRPGTDYLIRRFWHSLQRELTVGGSTWPAGRNRCQSRGARRLRAS
jgi:hypothetical protein